MDQLSAARASLQRVHDDPVAAERDADAVLATSPEDEARLVALWARGRARHEQGRLDDALLDLTTAAEVARQLGDEVGVARIVANRALTEYALGDTDAAMASLDAAEAALAGADAGHVHLQRAIVLVHKGDFTEARTHFDAAEDLLGSELDAVARCVASRGVASVYLGEFTVAADDFTEAIALGEATDQHLVVAGAIHNLGYVRARLGDTQAALRLFDDAARRYVELGSHRVLATLTQDRAETLLLAGLAPEAVDAARAAAAAFENAGATTMADDASLLVAEALLASGRSDDAASTATEVAGRLESAGRAAWAGRARYLAFVAAPASDVEAATALAERLDDDGWSAEARHVRLLAAEIDGAPATVRRRLLDDATRPDNGTLADVVRRLHGCGALAAANGDRATALQHAGEAISVVDEHRAVLTASELRAGASWLTTEVARFGLRHLLATGDARRVFDWIERTRGRSIGGRLAGSAGPGTELLAQLRTAYADQRRTPGSEAVVARVTQLEAAIRSGELQRTAAPFEPHSPVAIDELCAAMATAAASTMTFFEVDGSLHSVTVTEHGPSIRHHGDVESIGVLVDRQRFSLRRLVRGGGSAGVSTALQSLQAASAALDARLGLTGDRALVISPSRRLHAMVWAALPSCRARPLTLVPSATLWAVANARRGSSGGRVLAVAGPDLEATGDELRQIARLHGATADTRTGVDATVEAVAAAFADHAVVHVAAHGTFRADSPLFSGVELADGTLTLFDLPAAIGARIVVLPSCGLGSSRAMSGDEPLGPVGHLLGAGAAAVIAPLDAVGDAQAAHVSVGFHERLAAGAPSDLALASAIDDAVRAGEPTLAATAMSFFHSGASTTLAP